MKIRGSGLEKDSDLICKDRSQISEILEREIGRHKFVDHIGLQKRGGFSRRRPDLEQRIRILPPSLLCSSEKVRRMPERVRPNHRLPLQLPEEQRCYCKIAAPSCSRRRPYLGHLGRWKKKKALMLTFLAETDKG